jgi:type I restriction enzyme M protein
VFKKNRSRKDILFIDASNDGHYEKGKNQNNLREEDLQRIVDAYDKYGDIDKFAHVANLDEIRENEYNLNIPRYVDTFEEEEPVDMDAVKQNIVNIKKELAEVETKMEKQLEELGL